MTRVTAPVSKLTRSLSTTAAAPRPSNYLGGHASKSAAARVRKELENGHVDVIPASERGLTTSHRPVPNPHRTIPLMQTFHSSPKSSAQVIDVVPVDAAFLPTSDLLFPASTDDPFARVRVPLLPDNYAPNRAAAPGHVPEVEDPPLRAPEILVRAGAVSAFSEVEAMGPDGVELSFMHRLGGPAGSPYHTEDPEPYAGGMLIGL